MNTYIGSEALKRIVFVESPEVSGAAPTVQRVVKIFIGAELVFTEFTKLQTSSILVESLYDAAENYSWYN